MPHMISLTIEHQVPISNVFKKGDLIRSRWFCLVLCCYLVNVGNLCSAQQGSAELSTPEALP